MDGFVSRDIVSYTTTIQIHLSLIAMSSRVELVLDNGDRDQDISLPIG
jgi:hypothetical protein